MEPLPSPRGPGRIVLFNGASSSGKSTLAAAVRDALDEPFLHVSSDQFVAAGMVPARREDGGPFDRRIGEGRAHVEINGIHTFGRYDLDVDTTAGVTPELVGSVRTAWRQRVPYRGMLWRSEADREGAERGAV